MQVSFLLLATFACGCAYLGVLFSRLAVACPTAITFDDIGHAALPKGNLGRRLCYGLVCAWAVPADRGPQVPCMPCTQSAGATRPQPLPSRACPELPRPAPARRHNHRCGPHRPAHHLRVCAAHGEVACGCARLPLLVGTGVRHPHPGTHLPCCLRPPAQQVFPELGVLAAAAIVAAIMLPLSQIQVQRGASGRPAVLARAPSIRSLPSRHHFPPFLPPLQSVHDMSWLALAATGCMFTAIIATLARLLTMPDALHGTSLLPPPSTRMIEGLVAALNLTFAFGGQVNWWGEARSFEVGVTLGKCPPASRPPPVCLRYTGCAPSLPLLSASWQPRPSTATALWGYPSQVPPTAPRPPLQDALHRRHGQPQVGVSLRRRAGRLAHAALLPAAGVRAEGSNRAAAHERRAGSTEVQQRCSRRIRYHASCARRASLLQLHHGLPSSAALQRNRVLQARV